jgi:hypothetical protein
VTEPSDDGANAAPNAAKKVRGKPFPPGRSANPAGKKRGTKHRRTLWIAAMSEDDRAAIIAKVIKLAKAGDRVALRMVADRIDPPSKGRAVRLRLKPIISTDDVIEALASVTAAMAAGKISPEEAVEIGRVIEMQRSAIERQGLEARLLELERKHQ